VAQIGPFLLGKTLGVGAIAEVRLGTHVETKQPVAIKVIDKEFITAKAQKVAREIAVMKLLSHPRVLKLLGVHETPTHLYLVLEFVKGGNLFDYLVSKGPLSPNEALRFFHQLVEAVEYCHGNFICHRDLKPENVLLQTECDNLVLADYGLARLMKPSAILATRCGSPHYASPEVIMGLKYDGFRADIWSLGVILYVFVVGALPFDDPNVKIVMTKVKTGIYDIPPTVPPNIRDLITRMIVVDPLKRPTLEEIKNHPWFRSKMYDIQPIPVMRPSKIEVSDSTLDYDVLRSLCHLDWGPVDAIITALKSREANLEQSFYTLMMQRKENRDQFNRLFDPNYDKRKSSPNPDDKSLDRMVDLIMRLNVTPKRGDLRIRPAAYSTPAAGATAGTGQSAVTGKDPASLEKLISMLARLDKAPRKGDLRLVKTSASPDRTTPESSEDEAVQVARELVSMQREISRMKVEEIGGATEPA